MTAILRHFALNADDTPRARAFYERAFNWTWTPWGPPGFYQTRTAGRSSKSGRGCSPSPRS